MCNPLNAELNPICPLLALFGARHILHVSRIRVNNYCVILQQQWFRDSGYFVVRTLPVLLEVFFNTPQAMLSSIIILLLQFIPLTHTSG